MPRAQDVETFCRAVWRGETDTVRALVRRVDPNGTNRFGHTPLSMAVQYADLAVVRTLVRRGAAVDQGRTYLTPITLAARRGAADIVEFLRGAGARLSLFTFVRLGDTLAVRRELARDPSAARRKDEDGTPIVLHAAEALSPRIVSLLLARGATVGDADPNGETPLHRVGDMRGAPPACARRMAAFLLERGADPNARNWDDVTPLHQAVRARNVAVVQVLLAAGADPNARDKGGSTPLRRAVSSTGAGGTAGMAGLMAPLARLLLEHGADPDAKDKRGVPVRASARAPEVIAVLDEYAPEPDRTRPARSRRRAR
jgi:ankyrin repeat protein